MYTVLEKIIHDFYINISSNLLRSRYGFSLFIRNLMFIYLQPKSNL